MFNGMKFKTFTLENDLQVLAISDKRFVKSSAALAVMSGSMQNPEEHLGLAHFLEHLLFLGTDEFPEVGEYESFLNKNGGGHNAYTSIDHTNYFFDVAHEAFEGALHRFSRFFICPTFDQNYVDREKNAVNSEHEKNLKEDGRREHRFQQIITDPNHPYSKFATGDKETLKNADRDVVMEFYQRTYSSNLMRLVLMSPLDGDDLKKMSEKYFASIENKKCASPKYSDDLFLENQTPRFHQVQSVRDQDILKVSFDTPDNLPFWKSKPTSLLAHLIGEEGEGSLLSYLKSSGLALGLETSTWWRMFHIRVNLTEKGKANHQEVVRAIFSYIKLLKQEGLKKYIFDERKVLSEVELNNIEPKSSMGRASNFSASMLYYPVDDFLNRYYLFHEYSEKDFKKFIDCLNPEDMQVTLISQDPQNAEKEEYYGIQYKTETLPEAFIQELSTIEPRPELFYPEENLYIPTNFDLVKSPSVCEPTEELHRKHVTVYSQIDTELEIPRGSFSLSFVSGKIKGDPKKYLAAKLFAKLKREELNEWGYPARLAGLNYSISHGYNTITLDVSGYTHHLSDLLNNLILDEKHQRQIDRVNIDSKTFERVKLNFKKSLLNKGHDAAYQQLLYEMGFIFSTASVHRDDYIKHIDDIDLDYINSFIQDFFTEVAVRGYGFGNIEPQSMKDSIDYFFDKFDAQELSREDVKVFENRYTNIEDKDKNLFVFKGENNNNAEISLYKFSDWSIANQAKVDVIGKLLEQPFFTELRTHQQLGYVVAAFPSSNNGFTGLGTLIQSQTNNADDICNRSRTFVKQHLEELHKNISDEDVEAIKKSIINEISQKPNSMSERLSRFTLMAGQFYGDFDFFDKLVTELNLITSASLQSFIGEVIAGLKEDPQVVLLYRGVDDKGSEEMKGYNLVSDIPGFKSNAKKINPYKK